MKCPYCGADQGPLLPCGQYKRTVGVDFGGHRGVLWWRCPDCLGEWHRWPVGSDAHAKAEEIAGGPLREGESGR